MRSTTVFFVTIALVATLSPLEPVWAQQSQGDGEESAEQGAPSFKELTKRGASAFQQKDYEAAAEAFVQAYEIRQVPNLLYNAGRSFEKQGDFETALAYYERFVNQPDIEHKARRDALDRLKTLREVVELRKEGDQDEAERVQSEREGAEDAALAETDVDTAEPDETEQTPPPEPAEPVVEESYALAYTFGGLGVASLAAGGVFGALAAGANSEADDAATLAERRSAAESGQTYATLADGFLAGGVLLTGVGLYFFASPPTEEIPAGRADSSTATLAPAVGPDGASMTFTVEF